MFYSCKIQFREKNLILPFEKVPFLVLARNAIIIPHLMEAGRLARFPVRPESFRLDPDSICPESEVVSPRVWSRFARELRISLFLLEISENHKNQVKFKIFSDRWMDGWLSCNKARCQTHWSMCKANGLWMNQDGGLKVMTHRSIHRPAQNIASLITVC